MNNRVFDVLLKVKREQLTEYPGYTFPKYQSGITPCSHSSPYNLALFFFINKSVKFSALNGVIPPVPLCLPCPFLAEVHQKKGKKKNTFNVLVDIKRPHGFFTQICMLFISGSRALSAEEQVRVSPLRGFRQYRILLEKTATCRIQTLKRRKQG